MLSYTSAVDLHWAVKPASEFSNPGAAGETFCELSHNSEQCDRWFIRIKPDADEMSPLLQKNLVCHEIGHTVGFRDGGNAGASCMDGGDNAVLSDHEIWWIWARWG